MKRATIHFDGGGQTPGPVAAARTVSKGRQVAVDGRLLYPEWEAEDGSRRSKHSVVGRVEFLGSANGSRPAEEDSSEEGSDEVDIPF